MRRSSPATASPISSQLSRATAGDETTAQPAGQNGSGSRSQATHWVVPRKAEASDAREVVASAFSIQSRNGGLYRPSSTSGISHQAIAAATAASQASTSSRRSRERVRVSNHHSGNGSTAPVATAFTPPVRATASADRVAARRCRPGATAISGSSTHGAVAIGQASMLTGPSSVSIRGLTA